jgi:LacI family transcriptional regulator
MVLALINFHILEGIAYLHSNVNNYQTGEGAAPLAIRQKDIAEMLGITRTTVSRALNDSPLVSAELKSRVREICEKMDYHPDHSARCLHSGETKTISIMRYTVHLTELHSNWMLYLQREAHLLGYTVRLDHPGSIEQVIGGKAADGLIVFDSVDKYAEYPKLSKAVSDGKTPIIVTDCRTDAMENNSVAIDGANGVRQIIKHLIDLGHRQIAYLGVCDIGVGSERYESYINEMARTGLQQPGCFLILDSKWANEIEETYRVEESIVKAVKAGATAIIAASDVYAVGVIKVLRRNGFKVPEDVSVTGFDSSMLARAVEPVLTTVKQDIEGASKAIVAMLVERIKNSSAVKSRIVSSEIVLGGTTAKPKTMS